MAMKKLILLAASVAVMLGANAEAEKAFERGLKAHRCDNYTQAIADYDQAIELDPKYEDAYNNRGIAYAMLDDYKSSTKDVRKACELGDCDLLELLSKEKFIRD
jgi:tetratricopeptide (TPR) repeat protein